MTSNRFNWASAEKVLTLAVGVSIVIVLVLQLSSLYVAPVHNSQLWFGDESWLMNEYREQMTSGVFSHPGAIASSVQLGNPFPFTAMWVTSFLYGGTALLFDHANLVNVGRTVSALIALAVVAILLWRSSSQSLLPALAAVGMMISCRSFLYASHCARYDIFSALVILIVLLYLGSREVLTNKELMIVGLMLGSSLLISAHPFAILALPIAYAALRTSWNPIKLAPFFFSVIFVLAVLYGLHFLTQPALPSAPNVTYSVGDQPILHPFSKSFQRHNLTRKYELLRDHAFPVFLMLGVIVAGAARAARAQRKLLVLWTLPVVGWFFLEGGALSYLVYILPGLALACTAVFQSCGVGLRSVVTIGVLALLTNSAGEALQALSVGSTLTKEMEAAIKKSEPYLQDMPVIAMNAAVSLLESDPVRAKIGVYSTHFVLLPLVPQRSRPLLGSLLLFNRQDHPDFNWEAPILRSEIHDPSVVLTGQLLDAGRSYFEPLDGSQDTLLLQRLDLDTFIQHYRR